MLLGVISHFFHKISASDLIIDMRLFSTKLDKTIGKTPPSEPLIFSRFNHFFEIVLLKCRNQWPLFKISLVTASNDLALDAKAALVKCHVSTWINHLDIVWVQTALRGLTEANKSWFSPFLIFWVFFMSRLIWWQAHRFFEALKFENFTGVVSLPFLAIFVILEKWKIYENLCLTK